MNEIKFFSDQPLDIDREQEVRFGHLGIVNNLKQIVLTCPVPFTIGLFGKWGSGKTTILNILRRRLREDKVAVVNFDVWKHEGDALRRTFLKELLKQLKETNFISKREELTERLESTIQTLREIKKFTLNWKVWSILLIFIGMIIGIGLFLNHYFPEVVGTYLSIVFGGSIISTIFILVLQRMVISEKITTTSESFKDPHQFEAEFKRIVNNSYSDKLLIIVDNLDRCTHKKAVELLSTIKTFLAKDTDVGENKCIFLIACDDDAIKKHLESVYSKSQNRERSNEPFSADEFLRKFFNASICIPDFIDTELQTYTEDLLKETNIPQFDSSDLAYVITNAFRENPRQIKQFINILTTHFLLVVERESGKNPLIIPKGTISDNVAFLAKFLVIRQQFPSAYQQIREHHLTIEEVKNIENNEKFNDFRRVTKTITVPDIRPFIYLKQSKEERAIPGIRELEVALLEDKRDVVKEKLQIIKADNRQFNSLKRFIPSLIDRNKGRKIPLFNIFSSSLDAFHHHNLELGQEFYNKFADLLNDDETLKPELQRFEPSLVFKEVLTRCKNKEDRRDSVDQYISILSKEKNEKKTPAEMEVEEDYTYNIIKELLTNKEWLNQKQKENLRKTLAEIYFASSKILSLFEDKIEDQKELLSEQAISKFAGAFSDDDVENIERLNNKTVLLLKFKEIIGSSATADIVVSLQKLLENENQNPYREEKENLLKCIENIINVLHKQIVAISGIPPSDPHLDSFADTIVSGMDALKDWEQKKIFIHPVLQLIDILEESHQKNVDTHIRNFFNKADIDDIKFVFDKLYKSRKEEVINEYSEVFEQRVLQQQPIFDLLYPLASKEIRSQWMTSLIPSEPQRALSKINEINYKVDDKGAIVEALLQTASGIPIKGRGAIYDTINKMKCANDPALRDTFAAQIKPLLTNSDVDQQEVGYTALQGATHFSEPVKRDITRETIEWLRSLQPKDAGCTYIIKSVVINWDILESPVKENYIDFVFDKLIKRGIDIDNIRLGFEILFEIKTKYEDYSTYFDDVLDRTEKEEDAQIKVELKNGLLKLRLNKRNRNFWGKVEKLPLNSTEKS